MLFCAHAIFYFRLLDQKQETFLVHENVYLIDAEGSSQAAESAVKVARENRDLNEDGHLELNDRKAAYLFAGIGKGIEVELSPSPTSVSGLVGRELTYSEFEVDSLDQVFALARGNMVEVLYRD